MEHTHIFITLLEAEKKSYQTMKDQLVSKT